jgi:hypothetical protein
MRTVKLGVGHRFDSNPGIGIKKENRIRIINTMPIQHNGHNVKTVFGNKP